MSLSLHWRPTGDWKDTGLQGRIRDRYLGVGPALLTRDDMQYLTGYRDAAASEETRAAVAKLIDAIETHGEVEVSCR